MKTSQVWICVGALLSVATGALAEITFDSDCYSSSSGAGWVTNDSGGTGAYVSADWLATYSK